MASGDGCRADGLRFGGGGRGFMSAAAVDIGGFFFVTSFGFVASGSLASSSSESLMIPLLRMICWAGLPGPFATVSSSSSSSSSKGCGRAGLRTVVAAGLLTDFAVELSDPVVETRGTFDGRCGLKGGALRFDDISYTTASLGSLRGGILGMVI